MNKNIIIFFLSINLIVSAQDDAVQLKSIYSTSLTNGKSYEWLRYLSNEIGDRLSGSLNAELAVEYTKNELEQLG